jgi:sec-independent protein translocase protein TatA
MPLGFGWQELLVLLVIILVLFGYKKVPEMSRNLGRSLRIFKTEIREMRDEEHSESPLHSALDEPDHLAGDHHAGAAGDGQHGSAGGHREQHEVAHPQSR